jgi:hypothetical protein
MTTNALIIYNDDFKRRNFWDWVISHISGALPPHRYIGTVDFLPDSIVFNGYDTFLKNDCQIIVLKEEIQQVFHGYDDVYTIWQTRGLGMNWAPVRLQIDQSNNESLDYLYIIAGYNRLRSINTDLYKYLTDWLSQ